ncbi:type VII secretion protein EccB [Nocardia panacis]|uniref:Type VII secretion protein EccB n=1 Tax=Nocardia panacis TaxID=2340916 RepID=A0A3A4K503_9NOCA|nr:type VII secretion protein EccB [Nocardia panacis]RJO72105.1 type VII secretion protein EccB [Nocardia panacis]
MPAQLTTRAQVNGYRFLLRRLDHALVRRDVRMLHDPMRSQTRSMLVGAVLGVLVVAGFAILAFLKPLGAVGDTKIIIGKESGALYVLVADAQGNRVLHPALNLTSARLIAGDAESPNSVKESKLSDFARGPMLGIPGAPAALPGSGDGGRSDWGVCEAVQLSGTGSAVGSPGVLTTVFGSKPDLNDRIKRTASDEALLAQRSGTTYLIYDGKRAEIDPNNSVIARALNLGAAKPRPVGPGLLNAAEAVPPLTSPNVPGAGQPGPGRLSDIPVGGVIAVGATARDAKSELYVVLADSVQKISEFAAQVLRTANSQGMREIKPMPPDVLTNMPVSHQLPLDHFPAAAPRILSAEDAPVSCVSWSKTQRSGGVADSPGDRASVSLLAGARLPLANSAKPVELSSADGVGDRTDAAYIPPSTGEFVRITGMEAGSPRRGSLFYLADNGIRYGIPDIETAEVLGLGKAPKLAPWAIVGQFVPGPTLSKHDALSSYDTLPNGREK